MGQKIEQGEKGTSRQQKGVVSDDEGRAWCTQPTTEPDAATPATVEVAVEGIESRSQSSQVTSPPRKKTEWGIGIFFVGGGDGWLFS